MSNYPLEEAIDILKKVEGQTIVTHAGKRRTTVADVMERVESEVARLQGELSALREAAEACPDLPDWESVSMAPDSYYDFLVGEWASWSSRMAETLRRISGSGAGETGRQVGKREVAPTESDDQDRNLGLPSKLAPEPSSCDHKYYYIFPVNTDGPVSDNIVSTSAIEARLDGGQRCKKCGEKFSRSPPEGKQ